MDRAGDGSARMLRLLLEAVSVQMRHQRDAERRRAPKSLRLGLAHLTERLGERSSRLLRQQAPAEAQAAFRVALRGLPGGRGTRHPNMWTPFDVKSGKSKMASCAAGAKIFHLTYVFKQVFMIFEA